MLQFNEIKRDQKAGYLYFEYTGVWYGWDYELVLDTAYSDYVNGDIKFIFTNDTHMVTGIIPYDDFKVMSYADFIRYINAYMYYNTFELEVLD